ncbi:MAG TPA: hypothetical protein V6D02_16535, partial [Candidatus Obscuribacterales bacterium]
GDSVNIASRLESVDKERQPSDCRTLIGEDTFIRLSDQFIVEPWGDLVLKGRHSAIAVYRLVAKRTA